MTQEHQHNENINERNVVISILLNLGITLLEFIGGLVSNSLALVSDAFHNLSDTLAIFLSFLAIRFGRLPSNRRKTFGYKRLEILAALFNAAVLIGISLFLFVQAYQRLMDPEPVKGLLMLSVAAAGFIGNFVSVLLLRKDSVRSLNVRAAYLHLLADTLSSVAVIIGAVLMMLFRLYWIDPLLTFIIGMFIIRETYSVLRDTINILMESTPRGIDIDLIKAELEKDPMVDNIHHVHIWQLSDNQVHFECHADLCSDLPLSHAEEVRMNMERMLREKYHIHHVTIQLEFFACDDKKTIMGT